MTATEISSPPATPLDYLRLFRIPNVFTAIADVTMGFLFVHHALAPLPVFACLLLASCCLYIAGMVLNDVYDAAVDAVQRPERPIPSGRIPLGRATAIGYGLLLAGVVFGFAAGYIQPIEGAVPWRGGAVAVLLALCVVSYDRVLKRTPIGPIAMGGCRFFNVLLGMSIAAPFAGGSAIAGFGPHQFAAAAGIGIYIAGVTWFARTEATRSNKLHLAAATIVMMMGIVVLSTIYRLWPDRPPYGLTSEQAWWLLLGLLAFTILRRCGIAISDPTPQRVQFAVMHGIWSLIVFDAAVTLQVSPWYYAVAVLCLLIPTLILGRWIDST